MNGFNSFISSITQYLKPSSPKFNPTMLFSITVIPLAIVLVFLLLGDKNIRLAESFSVTIAQMDWSEFWQTVSMYEANQGLYYVILKLWIVFGDSETALRSLSAVVAVLVVVATYVLGKHLFGWRTGIIAALLVTVNAFFIDYAQEARGYTLALLLAVLSSYFFIRANERPSARWWIAYMITGALGVYTHLYFALLLIAQFASLVFLPGREIPWKSLIISGLSIIILIIPMAYFVLVRDAGQIAWVSTPDLESITVLFHHLTGRGEYLSVIAYLIFCGIALFFTVKTFLAQRRSPELWRHAFLLCCLFIPIVISFVFSFIKPIYYYRYFVILIPFLAVYAALGITYLKRRWLVLAAIGLLLVISSFSLRGWYSNDPSEEYTQKGRWEEIVSYIVTRAEPDDAIVFFLPFAKLPYDYYHNQLNGTEDIPNQVHYYSDEEELNIYQLPGDLTHGQSIPDPDISLLERLNGYDNIWLILAYNRDEEKQNQSTMIYDMLTDKYGTPRTIDYSDDVWDIVVHRFENLND